MPPVPLRAPPKGGGLPIQPLDSHPQMRQLIVDSFEENMAQSAIRFLRITMSSSIPPNPTIIQYIMSVAMCSQKAAMKREKDLKSGALKVRPEELRMMPQASEIVDAVEMLHRLVDTHHGEILAALPPYQRAETIKRSRASMGQDASMDEEEEDLPHPASEFGSSVSERPVGGSISEANLGAWFPMRAWVWDYLMNCSNVWQMANIGQEYWELSNNNQRRHKDKRRKLAAQEPLVQMGKERAKDLSGFWNVMAIAVKAWKRQHELIIRKLEERQDIAAVRLPPSEVAPLSLFSQLTSRISSAALWPTATRQVREMLEIVEVGLRSTELNRPVNGTIFPHPNTVAMDVLREALLLCEVGLIETHTMIGWMSTQMASPVQVDEEGLPRPGLDFSDEKTFSPQAWSLEQVKRVEMMIRRMSSPRIVLFAINRIYDAALLQAVASVTETEDQVQYAEMFDLGFFDAVPNQIPAPRHLMRAEKLAALSMPGKRILLEEFRQFSSFSLFVRKRSESGLKQAAMRWENSCNAGRHQPSWKIIWEELEASARRNGSKLIEAQPGTDIASQSHAQAFFAAWEVVQLRAVLRMCALKVAIFRRAPCAWHAQPELTQGPSPVRKMLGGLQQWQLGLLNARLGETNFAKQQISGAESDVEQLFKESGEKFKESMDALNGEIAALDMLLARSD